MSWSEILLANVICSILFVGSPCVCILIIGYLLDSVHLYNYLLLREPVNLRDSPFACISRPNGTQEMGEWEGNSNRALAATCSRSAGPGLTRTRARRPPKRAGRSAGRLGSEGYNLTARKNPATMRPEGELLPALYVRVKGGIPASACGESTQSEQEVHTRRHFVWQPTTRRRSEATAFNDRARLSRHRLTYRHFDRNTYRGVVNSWRGLAHPLILVKNAKERERG